MPISFLNKYNPDQFEIVAFRREFDDGKDLVVSVEERRGEMSSSHTSEYLFEGLRHPAANGERAYVDGQKKCARILIRHLYTRTNKNAEGKINGKITYARVTIRRKGSEK